MHQGYTAKFCHYCRRLRPHAIISADGMKFYICQDTDHEYARQAKEQGDERIFPAMSYLPLRAENTGP